MSGCFDQEFLDSIGKNPCCSTQVIFDSGCLSDGVPGTPEKEVIDRNVQMESSWLENQAPPSARNEMQFVNGDLVPEEKSQTVTTDEEGKFPTDIINEEMDDFRSHLYSILGTSSKVLSPQLQSHSAICELARYDQSENFVPEEKLQNNAATPKRRKLPTDNANQEVDNFKSQLYAMLETSSKVLSAHVEVHNANCQLDRNQRQEDAENLVCALGKLADALGKIADKL